MKKINNLSITVTYTVIFSDLEVADEVFESLYNVSDEGGHVDELNNSHSKAQDWISDNVKDDDACEWEYTVYDID